MHGILSFPPIARCTIILFAKQSLELTAKSLAQAENELKIVETEREHGVAC